MGKEHSAIAHHPPTSYKDREWYKDHLFQIQQMKFFEKHKRMKQHMAVSQNLPYISSLNHGLG